MTAKPGEGGADVSESESSEDVSHAKKLIRQRKAQNKLDALKAEASGQGSQDYFAYPSELADYIVGANSLNLQKTLGARQILSNIFVNKNPTIEEIQKIEKLMQNDEFTEKANTISKQYEKTERNWRDSIDELTKEQAMKLWQKADDDKVKFIRKHLPNRGFYVAKEVAKNIKS